MYICEMVVRVSRSFGGDKRLPDELAYAKIYLDMSSHSSVLPPNLSLWVLCLLCSSILSMSGAIRAAKEIHLPKRLPEGATDRCKLFEGEFNDLHLVTDSHLRKSLQREGFEAKWTSYQRTVHV